MYRLALIIICQAFFSVCLAQTPYFPDYSDYDADKLGIYWTEKNFNTYKKNGKRDAVISQTEFDEFCEITAYSKKDFINKGLAYQNLEGCETYLQKLVDRIIKANNLDLETEVILLKKSSANAFVMHGKELFVHIGLLANVENESQLAFVLAHELAHTINNDPLKGFARSVEFRKRKNRRNALERLITNANYNRQQESTADSFALYALNELDLIDKDLSNLFSYVISVDSIYSAVSAERSLSYVKTNIPDTVKPLEKLLRSHPESFKRANFIDSIAKGELKANKTLNNPSAFYKAKRHAQYEVLHLLLNTCQYQQCIDKSFRYHLVSAKDASFVYYLLEGLRRQMYVDEEYAGEVFLSKIYKEFISEEESIFDNPELLIQSDSSLLQVYRHPLFKAPTDPTNVKGWSNSEVFYKMAEIAQKMGIEEALFSVGLHEYVQDQKKALKDYATLKNGHYSKFAKEVLNEKQFDTKNKTQLVILNDLNFIEEKSYGYRLHLIESEKKSQQFQKYLLNFSKSELSQFKIETASSMVQEDYGKLMEILDGFKTLSSIYGEFDMDLLEDKGPSDEVVFEYDNDDDDEEKEFDLFILSPELWMLYEKYDLKTIDIVSSISFDSRSNNEWILKLIYPPAVIYNVMYGSSLNSYWMMKTKATPFTKHNPLQFSESEVNYKVNKYFYTNSFYYLMLEE